MKQITEYTQHARQLSDIFTKQKNICSHTYYLIVNNHGFVDGNKRIAAMCFLVFLKKNDLPYTAEEHPIISNEALASLTLFIATSKSEEKGIEKLIISVLNRNQ